MLLSRGATSIFDFGELVAAPTAAAVISMSAEARSSSVVGWISPPQGPPWKTDLGSDDSPFPFAFQRPDESGSDGLAVQRVNEGDPADVLDPMSPVGEEDWPEGLIFEDLDGIPEIPWTADHTVEGSLDASRAQVAYKVPVGPETGSLRLFLRPVGGGAEASPVIDKLFLVDPSGQVLARITMEPVDGGGDESQGLLVVLLDAPEGSELVVHLTVKGGWTTPPGEGADPNGGDPGTQPPPPYFETTDFALNIQRNDSEPPAPLEDPSSPSPSPTTPIGAAPPSSGGLGGGWRPIQTMNPVADGLIWIEASRSGANGDRSATGGDSEVVVASSVYLGPLISRGGAPLGPTLATSVEDPTPMIEREGRVVDEAIERIESELGDGLLASMKRRETLGLEPKAMAERMAGPIEETSEAPMAAMPGPGGLPVLVSRIRRNSPRDDAGELAAHLQSRSVEEALTAEFPDPPAIADQMAAESEVARAGLATRAAGLIVGLGLATGPLYPDLVALAKKRLSRAKRFASARRWPFRGGRSRSAV